jgi:serine/threonine protein kinase
MLPLALVMCTDDTHLYTIFKTRVATDLASLIGETGFDEEVAKFHVACLSLALEYLQNLDQSPIIYRNITTDAVVLDSEGYVQLMDFRYAVRATPAPNDFCGYAHYLSPEQVSGQGHGTAADWWALGILTYEMICGGANPWLTGDAAKDSEVGVYQRISLHQAGALKFPDGCSPSGELTSLLNGLLSPIAATRLGARGIGPKEMREQAWFGELAWERLEAGELVSPHKEHAEKALATAVKTNRKQSVVSYSGDKGLFSTFSTLSSLSA